MIQEEYEFLIFIVFDPSAIYFMSQTYRDSISFNI
jgi:hypothetical protein